MQAGKRNILFLVQYPENVSPGQRFRFELYKALLQQNNFVVTSKPFIDEQGYAIIFRKGYMMRKARAVFKGFLHRLFLVFTIHKYSYIFLQLGAAPVGPPFFEMALY